MIGLISFFISSSIRAKSSVCDAMRQFQVVIKAIYRRAGGELGFRPDSKNGRGEDMCARVTKVSILPAKEAEKNLWEGNAFLRQKQGNALADRIHHMAILLDQLPR